jgi:hypothetical protein
MSTARTLAGIRIHSTSRDGRDGGHFSVRVGSDSRGNRMNLDAATRRLAQECLLWQNRRVKHPHKLGILSLLSGLAGIFGGMPQSGDIGVGCTTGWSAGWTIGSDRSTVGLRWISPGRTCRWGAAWHLPLLLFWAGGCISEQLIPRLGVLFACARSTFTDGLPCSSAACTLVLERLCRLPCSSTNSFFFFFLLCLLLLVQLPLDQPHLITCPPVFSRPFHLSLPFSPFSSHQFRLFLRRRFRDSGKELVWWCMHFSENCYSVIKSIIIISAQK